MNQSTRRLKPLQISIIVLAVASGLVHLYRGVSMLLLFNSFAGRANGAPPLRQRPPGTGGTFQGRPPGGGFSIMSMLPVPLPYLFILNFVGYMVLAIALYLPAFARYRSILRWMLIAYAIVTIIMWALITMARPEVLGYSDKVVELSLIALLLIDGWQSSRREKVATAS